MSFSTLPTYETWKGSSVWYRFFQGLFKGTPPASETGITLTTSPMTFTTNQRGFVLVQGGSVSLVQISRGGISNHTTGATQGAFPLSAGDSLVMTYTGNPVLTFFPQ